MFDTGEALKDLHKHFKNAEVCLDYDYDARSVITYMKGTHKKSNNDFEIRTYTYFKDIYKLDIDMHKTLATMIKKGNGNGYE
jgi:hypothetical protein